MTEIATMHFEEGDASSDVAFRRIMPGAVWENLAVGPTTGDVIHFYAETEPIVEEWAELMREKAAESLARALPTELEYKLSPIIWSPPVYGAFRGLVFEAASQIASDMLTESAKTPKTSLKNGASERRAHRTAPVANPQGNPKESADPGIRRESSPGPSPRDGGESAGPGVVEP